MEYLMVYAEMDSPISMTDMHPYGRRRKGNGRTGTVALSKRNM